jgi:hypothetical protein
VAGLTGLRRWNMIGVRRLTQRQGSIVASRTTTADPSMVHDNIFETDRIQMARLTRLSCRDVIAGLTDRPRVVVAGRAPSRDASMIKFGGVKCRR